jgi:hypothetical protein
VDGHAFLDRHAIHPHAIAWRIFGRIAEGDAEQQLEIIGYAKNTRMVPAKKPIDVCGMLPSPRAANEGRKV